MSLKDEIQRDIVDPSINLSTILRKAAILAHRLRSEEFKAWVDQEMNGYSGRVQDLPDYRKTATQTYGHFSGPFGSGYQNAPIPTKQLPAEIHEYATTFYFVQSVRELESMIETGQRHLRFPWPADYTVVIADKIYQDMVCMQAWKAISIDQVEGVLNTVRNRLLIFVLELEGIDPESGESNRPSPTLPPEKVAQVFNNYILGSHNIVAAGASVTQSVTQQIAAGDFESLRNVLKGLSVPNASIEQLKIAIDEDGERPRSEGFGHRVKSWIAGMVQKAAEGTWHVALETAALLLSNALSSYYGWR